MHLDQEKLQRILHGELIEEESLSIRDHLAECTPCQLRVREAEVDETEILDLLSSLDNPVPLMHLDAIRARAGAPRFRWGRWAAGVILALGVTSAAYAAPGSPLPSLVRRIADRLHPASPVPMTNPEMAPPLPSPSGIAVSPGDNLSIQFSSHQARGQVRVELTDQTDLLVRSLSGVSGFTSDLERLVVENEGSESDFEIQIPRSAPRVEILVGGETRFSKVGDQVTASSPADAAGRFFISLRSPGP